MQCMNMHSFMLLIYAFNQVLLAALQWVSSAEGFEKVSRLHLLEGDVSSLRTKAVLTQQDYLHMFSTNKQTKVCVLRFCLSLGK